MSKQSLNDEEFLDKAFEALTSGNGVDVNSLMNSDRTELVNNPDQEQNDEDESVSAPPVQNEPEAGDTQKEDVKPKEGEAKPEEISPYAWLDLLPEQQKEAVKDQLSSLTSDNTRLQQYFQSNEGRVSGLQKKINSLEREIESRKSQPPPQSQTKAAVPDVAIEDDDALAQLKEDDPALYRVLKQREERTLSEARKLVEQAKQEFNSTLEKQVAPFYESQEDAYIRQEQQKVLSVVTNADKVISSKEWKMFEQMASPGVKGLINSNDSRDVIEAFKVYADWLVDTGVVRPNAPIDQQTAAPATNRPNTDTEKLQAARQKRLQAGAVGSATLTGQPDDLDADKFLEKAFQEIYEKEGFGARMTKR